jgi:PEP-CTERM motif-containing protein
MTRYLTLFIVAAVLWASPAHADPILYHFTAEVDGINPLVAAAFPIGTVISGRLLFDSDAALISYSQQQTPPDGALFIPGLQTNATYDASGFVLSAVLNGVKFETTGTTLAIQDVQPGSYAFDYWHLGSVGSPTEIAGVDLNTIQIILNMGFGRALSNADLEVPTDLTLWQEGYGGDQRLLFGSTTQGGMIGSHLTSITREEVPEPSTLLLLLVGLGVARRLRRQAA